MWSLVLASAFASTALAQNAAYAQCGGLGFTGSTSCVAGYSCVYSNTYYSQCLPGTSSATTTTAASTTLKTSTTTSAISSPTSTGKNKFLGINLSCAEFGSGTYPGTWGVDFTFMDNSSISTFINEGFNIFRVAFAMERLVPNELTGPADPGYLANLTGTVNYITENGAYAIVDPHNYGRYYGNVITDTTGFGAFWTTVATHFKNNDKVIFDTNNEYHDEDRFSETNVLNMNQAAINAIRAAGATTQYIFAEGNDYTAAYTWNTTNTNLAALTDSDNKLVYEMHQYLDSDNSGTSATCVSNTIGVERIEGATTWLRANGKIGIIGETAGGANSVCLEAIEGILEHLQANSDVWLGALWWAAGPWWGDYIYSFEPPSGTAYEYYESTLAQYAP
ncbi:cellulase [Xylariaceae sp. FL0255]|nr:cellulase [Xylariaceae sp. FL0255]